ncbi:hypothetical protein QV13_04820 [Mesorhizobium hungaricum]|uniref:Transcriptional regulator n=2 Tax=Hyphomicrobiales TaxID=356 RepID=A0A1C2E7E9_9HYPH|nr:MULTISPECIES: transposase [unclassified Mesorhizobium]MBN9237387.1 transposase [Mesorhizobium sp.]MDQ0333315.1 hypothetical protein [Mesorhizobium sp. YL-MeA3-2017]OCX22909.1 hypothetical protein QV13_04820 [Mesorhizobium hungaricum]
MPDLPEAETVEAVTEAPAAVEAPEPKKKAPRPKKAKATSKPRVTKEATKPALKAAEAPPAPARAKRKTYSEKERAQKVGQIKKAIGSGDSVKVAVGKAEISEQTYYQWLRASQPATKGGDFDLERLAALEKENKDLMKQLEERLLKQNAELKRKLGIK